MPVVCVTAHTQREFDALRAGCSAFLTKPCAPSALLAVLEKLIGLGSEVPTRNGTEA
jgi:CheY-like chemotaxis protein